MVDKVMQLTRVGLQSNSWGSKGHFSTRIMSTKRGHQIKKSKMYLGLRLLKDKLSNKLGGI